MRQVVQDVYKRQVLGKPLHMPAMDYKTVCEPDAPITVKVEAPEPVSYTHLDVYKRQRVSSTPGKTATINFYSVDDCYFVDLPGYGYAKVSNADRERWDDLINSYFEAPRHHTCLLYTSRCV